MKYPLQIHRTILNRQLLIISFTILNLSQLSNAQITNYKIEKAVGSEIFGYYITMGDLHPFSPVRGTTFGIPDSSFVDVNIINDQSLDTINLFSNTMFGPGTYMILWDGRDSQGIVANHGIYYIELIAQSKSSSLLNMLFWGRTKFLNP
jgi:hypothetical protein